MIQHTTQTWMNDTTLNNDTNNTNNDTTQKTDIKE